MAHQHNFLLASSGLRLELGTSHREVIAVRSHTSNQESGNCWANVGFGGLARDAKQPSKKSMVKMSFLQNDGNDLLIMFIKIAYDAMFYIALLFKCPHLQLKCCVSV